MAEDPKKIGRDTDGAEGAEALAPKALAAKAGKGRAVSPVCRSGGWWRDRQADRRRRAAEAAIHSPFQPEGEKLFGT